MTRGTPACLRRTGRRPTGWPEGVSGVAPLQRGPVLFQGVGGRDEHALVTVLPPDQVGRGALLAVNLDDHPFADLIAHMASPDHQFIAGFCVLAVLLPFAPTRSILRRASCPTAGPKVRGTGVGWAFPRAGEAPGSQVQPGSLVGDVVKFCGSRTEKQVSYIGQGARHRDLLADSACV
jgi:hypothetical protein